MLPFLARESARFDVIHAHNFHALPLLMAAVAGRAPLVVSPYLHPRSGSSAAELLHRLYDPLAIQRIRRRTAAVICLSHGEADLASRRLGIDAERITVIPSGLAAQPVTEPGPREQVVLSVGRLEHYKRVDRLIEAAAELPEPWRLVVVGGGSAEADLAARVRRLGLGSRVELLGRLSDEDLAGWYRRAEVFASLSEAESFGIAILDALAAGCRVVCGDIPAFRDFATEFPSAVSSVPATAGAVEIADAIENAAAADAPWPLDFGRFSWDGIVAAHRSVYAAVAARAAEQQPVMAEVGTV
jgi:glycosyltransferase involved in cell wall biosynthesis